MIESILQYLGLALVYLAVTIEALYLIIVPLLLLGIIAYHSWERIKEGIEHRRYRKQARKLLGDLRVYG